MNDFVAAFAWLFDPANWVGAGGIPARRASTSCTRA